MKDGKISEQGILGSQADSLPNDVAGTASNVFVNSGNIYSDHRRRKLNQIQKSSGKRVVLELRSLAGLSG